MAIDSHNDQSASQKSGSSRWPSLSQMRDAAVAVFGLTYVLGYLVWAVQARHYRLGWLPLGQTQYFAAGLIPLVIVASVIGLMVRARQLLTHLQQWTGTLTISHQERLFLLFAALTTVPMFVIGNQITQRVPNAWIFLIALTVFWILLASLEMFNPPRPEVRWKVVTTEIRFFLSLLLAIATPTLLMMTLYSRVLYPNLPVEFGGTKPRVAVLNIDASRVAGHTRVLMEARATPEDEDAFRSVPLVIYFVGSSSTLVRVRGKTEAETMRGDLIELPNSSILVSYYFPD